MGAGTTNAPGDCDGPRGIHLREGLPEWGVSRDQCGVAWVTCFGCAVLNLDAAFEVTYENLVDAETRCFEAEEKTAEFRDRLDSLRMHAAAAAGAWTSEDRHAVGRYRGLKVALDLLDDVLEGKA